MQMHLQIWEWNSCASQRAGSWRWQVQIKPGHHTYYSRRTKKTNPTAVYQVKPEAPNFNVAQNSFYFPLRSGFDFFCPPAQGGQPKGNRISGEMRGGKYSRAPANSATNPCVFILPNSKVYFLFYYLYYYLFLLSNSEYLCFYSESGPAHSIHSNVKKNYFTSCDPHHDIYTFSYWQIFWHSI